MLTTGRPFGPLASSLDAGATTQAEALGLVRGLAVGLDAGDVARLLERVSSHEAPELLRAALLELGAAALLLASEGAPRASARELVALDMAARGCVSGTLAEWPVLAAAFRAAGWSLPATLGAIACRLLAVEALKLLASEAAQEAQP